MFSTHKLKEVKSILFASVHHVLRFYPTIVAKRRCARASSCDGIQKAGRTSRCLDFGEGHAAKHIPYESGVEHIAAL